MDIIVEQLTQSNNKGEEFKKIATILLKSINDWPIEIITLEQFVNEVRYFIQNVHTKNNICFTLNRVNYSVNSWQAESLYGLQDVFEFYQDGISLYDIIKDILSKVKI
ncbi:hypothetical protein ACLI08_07850 [Flavobacterium sp. RNTU_13]|uniref:hypothetical protein n=1 Tax=Flavobacterium sp. RNTU_13 TaxID=3375145 RepID=UPI00398774DD